MRTQSIRWVVAVFAAVFIAQTVNAATCLPSTPIVESMPENLPTIGITLARREIERQFIGLGRDPIEVGRMVGQLTDEDLLVLVSNPGMMQEAGAANATNDNLILALILVGLLFVALYAADSGSFVQN